MTFLFSNFLTNFTFFDYFFLGTTDDVYSLNYMCFCSIMNRHKVCELWCFHQFDEFSKNQKNQKVCGLWCFHQFDEFLQNFHFFEKKCQKKSFCFTILILTSRKQWFWWIRHNPKIHQLGSFMKADGIPAKVLRGGSRLSVLITAPRGGRARIFPYYWCLVAFQLLPKRS